MPGPLTEEELRRLAAVDVEPDNGLTEEERARLASVPDDLDEEPAPKDSSTFQRSRMAREAVQKALAGMPNDQDEDLFFSRLDRIQDPRLQDAIRDKADTPLKHARQLQKVEMKGEDREATLRDAVPGLFSSDPIERNRSFMDTQRAAAKAVTYPLMATLNAIDSVTAKPLRTALAYGLNLPQTPDSPPEMRRRPVSTGKGTFGADYVFDPVRLRAAEELANDSEKTSRALIDTADQEGLSARGTVAGLSTLPGRSLGSMVGAGLTAAMTPIAVATEARPWFNGETDAATIGKNLWGLAKDNNRAMQEFGVGATLDLSNALSFGGSSAARNGLRAVLAATGDEALAKGVAEALTRTAGTVDQIPAIINEFEKAGRTAADAEAIFGPELRHAGQGMLEVGVPFTQISTPIDDSYRFRKWLAQYGPAAKAVDAGADLIGANRVYDRTPEFVHAERRVGTAIESKKRDAMAAKVKAGLAALPEPIRKAWTNKKFREEFYTRAIRPDFDRTRPAEQMTLFDAPENPKPKITPLYEETMPAAGQTPIVEPKYSPFTAPRQGEMFAAGDVQPKPFPWEPEGMRPKETTDYGQTLTEEPTSTPAPLPGLFDERVTVNVPDEKGGFHALTAAEDYVPYDQLDAVFGTGAKQLFDLIRDTHEEARQSLVAAGHLTEAQAAKDPFSGIYMRRPVQSKNGLFDEITIAAKQSAPSRGMNAIRKNRVGAEDGFPGGLSRSEMELPGPDGEAFMAEQSTDPAKLWADYVRLYGRAEGETVFRQNVAQKFGREVQPGDRSAKNLGVSVQSVRTPAYSPGPGEVKEFAFDPQVANIMDQAFAPGSGRLSRVVRNLIPGETPAGRAAIRGAEMYDSAQNFFKSNVLRSPAYHATNYYNDTLRDVLEGNANPLQEQGIALDMMSGGDGPLKLGSLDTTIGEERQLAQAAGLPLNLEASHRFDLEPAGGLAGEFIDAAKTPSAARSLWRTLLPPELGGSPLMRTLGERAETMQKTSTYLRQRALGASPAEAVARAGMSKIDYQWRNPLEQAASTLIPFSKYMTEAPRRTARTMLQRPGSIAALDDLYNAFDRNEDVTPRDSLQQTRFMRLGGQHARLMSNVIRELGAGVDYVFGDSAGTRGPPTGIPEGLDPILTIKDDTFDSPRPFMHAEQMGAALAPPLRAGIEALAKTQLSTGQELDPPTLTSMFPWGAGFPDALTANKGQMPWLSTYVPNYVPVVGARPYQLLANMALGMNNQDSPLTVFGNSRAYTPEIDRRAAYAHQILNFISPFSLYAEDPASALVNMDRRSDARAALRNHNDAQASFERWLEGLDR